MYFSGSQVSSMIYRVWGRDYRGLKRVIKQIFPKSLYVHPSGGRTSVQSFLSTAESHPSEASSRADGHSLARSQSLPPRYLSAVTLSVESISELGPEHILSASIASPGAQNTLIRKSSPDTIIGSESTLALANRPELSLQEILSQLMGKRSCGLVAYLFCYYPFWILLLLLT